MFVLSVNTPGGVKRSGLGAHAAGLLVMYYRLFKMLWFRNVNYCIWQGIPVSYCSSET